MPESRESFLKRFEILGMEAQARIELAYIVAKCEHHWQTRRQGGRYFDHPRAAAIICADEVGCLTPDIIIALEIHDLVEDTKYATIDKVRLWFGNRVAHLVDSVTKRKGESKKAYYARMREAAKGDCGIALVKGCDNLHNLRSLDGTDESFARFTMKKSQLNVLPMLEDVAATWASSHYYGKIRDLVHAELASLTQRLG